MKVCLSRLSVVEVECIFVGFSRIDLYYHGINVRLRKAGGKSLVLDGGHRRVSHNDDPDLHAKEGTTNGSLLSFRHNGL